MYKVLIANRDKYDTNGIQWLLQSSAFTLEVQTAESNLETIAKLEAFQPDLLILELDMLDSLLETSLTKSLQMTQPVIIAITIEPTFEQAKKAIELGVKDLLLKPLSPETLLNSVRKVMRMTSSPLHKPVLLDGKVDSGQIDYQQLFIDKENSAAEYTFIGFKTDQANKLATLFRFLEEYKFCEQLQLFALSDIIIGMVKRSSASWIDECRKMMNDWLERSNIPIAIVIHNDRDAAISIQEKYLQTRQMMEITFFNGYKKIVQFDKPLKWAFLDPFITPNEQRQWIDFLNHANIDAIREWLFAEFLHYKDPYPNPYLLRTRLTNILAQIRRHMKAFHLHSGNLEDEYLELFNTVLYSPLLYKIIQDFIEFTAKVLDGSKHQDVGKQDLVERILHYVEANYWNISLTLEDTAQFVERNPTYLSTLLSQKTGKTFREILTDYRIQAAKKLLVETDMPLKEVATLSGFSNQSYFNKVFKKAVTMSPNQYRHKRSMAAPLV